MSLLLLHPGGDLHYLWVSDLRRLVHRGRLGLSWPSSFLSSVLFGSQAFFPLRWMAPVMILEEVNLYCGFT
jgi:hypothetical protein